MDRSAKNFPSAGLVRYDAGMKRRISLVRNQLCCSFGAGTPVRAGRPHAVALAAACLASLVACRSMRADAQGLGGPTGGTYPGEGTSSGLPAAGTGITNPGSIDPGDQGSGGGGGGGSDEGGKGKDQAPPPPPALPGSHAHPTAVVPADKVVADMDPTSALFDAINRGDTVAARDAINRGASLDGRNVLGLTPIELSVDLNRNDISFLLLSMRGTSGTSQPAATVGRKASAISSAQAGGRFSPARATSPSVAQTAVPDAGFLGFGRPARF